MRSDWGRGSFSTDGVNFVIPVNDEMARWWEDRFGAFNLTPKDICERLVADLPFNHEFKIMTVNPEKGYVCVEITGADNVGEVFLTARSIEFTERQLHLNMTEVKIGHQGHGYGTTLARNCYRLARLLEMERLGVTALDGGSYVWARAGFLPTPQSWDDNRCKQRIAEHMGKIPELDWQSRNNIYSILGSNDRQGLWVISDLEQEVASTKRADMTIPLGRALLAESGASWRGTLEFDDSDPEIQGDQLDRARGYLGLGDDE